jgi:hypothetical protein
MMAQEDNTGLLRLYLESLTPTLSLWEEETATEFTYLPETFGIVSISGNKKIMTTSGSRWLLGLLTRLNRLLFLLKLSSRAWERLTEKLTSEPGLLAATITPSCTTQLTTDKTSSGKFFPFKALLTPSTSSQSVRTTAPESSSQ